MKFMNNVSAAALATACKVDHSVGNAGTYELRQNKGLSAYELASGLCLSDS